MPFKLINNIWNYYLDIDKYKIFETYPRTVSLTNMVKKYSGSWTENLNIWRRIYRSYMEYYYFTGSGFPADFYNYMQFMSDSDKQDLHKHVDFLIHKFEYFNSFVNFDASLEDDDYEESRQCFMSFEWILNYNNTTLRHIFYPLPGYEKPIKQFKNKVIPIEPHVTYEVKPTIWPIRFDRHVYLSDLRYPPEKRHFYYTPVYGQRFVPHYHHSGRFDPYK